MGRVSDAKDRLLDAAIKLVWRSSFAAVSVEDICNEAGVKKGSFYHFYPGKNELVAAAFLRFGELRRPDYDRIFSSSVPPIDRLRTFFAWVVQFQKELHKETGCVLGCPFASIGTELIAPDGNDGGLRDAIQHLIGRKLRYIETTLRDGMADGSIPKGNAEAIAKTLYLYMEGAMAHARIQNEPNLLNDIEENGLRLVGCQSAAVAAV